MKLLRLYIVGIVALPVVVVTLLACLPLLMVDQNKAMDFVERLQGWFTRLAKGGGAK